MNQKYQSVKGTKDLLPAETRKWQFIENRIRTIMHHFGYDEIRTPIFEETSLFARSIGEETDIVGKEMYSFPDKGNTSLTLRPEMTASVVRAYIQHHLGEQSSVTKLFYIAPMFRQEKPQAGRLRQFNQFGMESIGQSNALCDVEIISLAAEIYRSFGIEYELKINSVGDSQCRPKYREALQKFLRSVYDTLSPESQKRCETNVLRVLDSKDERDQEATMNAPSIIDFLCADCKSHFDLVIQSLDAVGIRYVLEHRLVRGLDYYTKTAFEFISNNLGAQDALGGGGRYDNLIEELGGDPMPAVGYAAGIERLAIVLEKKQFAFSHESTFLYIVGLDDESREFAFQKALELRRNGITTEIDFAHRSLKAQMREANKLQSRFVVIIGDEEMKKQTAVVKTMASGEQFYVEFPNLLSYFDSTK